MSKRLVVVMLTAVVWPVSRSAAQIDELSPLERRAEDTEPVAWHLADPRPAARQVESILPAITRPADKKYGQSLLKSLRSIERPSTVPLSLAEALQRTLINSHNVRVQSYAPAVSRTTLVEAEAVFDALYFMNFSNNNVDTPTATQLIGNKSVQLNLSSGLRKLLPSGMQVSTSLNLNRQSTDNRFQIINPVYTSSFVAEFMQPLMRNGGIDVTRSRVTIAGNDLGISEQTFRRQVRDILFNVEQLYWQLVTARREVTIRARLLADFEKIYDYLWQRRDFDTYQIQLSQTAASLEQSRADFIVRQNEVYNAQDRLLAAINDPDLNLLADVEIIPTDFPEPTPVVLDPLAEVQTALANREEIIETRLRIENARVQVGVAKNQALPRLDLTFRYTVDGLGTNADQAFDQVTQTDFTEYFVGVNFELPVGNRAAEAALRRAKLQYAQSVASLKAQQEQVVLEVNVAMRRIQTAYELIDPVLQSAEANEDQVASVIARAQRRDFTALNQELGARNSLAESRSQLLKALENYNIALIELERAKGTLLQYDNITVVDEPH